MPKQILKYTTSPHVYYTCGGVFTCTLEAPTRKELLVKMRDFALQYDKTADFITFGTIKKLIQSEDEKGMFIRFKRFKKTEIPHWSGCESSLEKYFTEFRGPLTEA